MPVNKNGALKLLHGRSKETGGDDTIEILNESLFNIFKNASQYWPTTKNKYKEMRKEDTTWKAGDIERF